MTLAEGQVVVGLPIYNGANFVEAAVDSLLGQTLSDFRLLIIDNASTDTTPKILESLAETDDRIEIRRNATNIGANANFNAVAEWALEDPRTKYFKWAAHDDVCEPRFLEACVGALEEQPGATLAYPKAVHIDALGEPMPAEDPPPKAIHADPVERFEDILHDEYGVFYIFGVIRATALRATTLFGPHWPPDKALAAWLTLQGPFIQVPEPLFLRRTHLEQSSSLTSTKQAEWSGSRPRARIPSPVWATLFYLRAIRSAPLSTKDRSAAYMALLKRYIDLEKWSRVVVPGPDNYLGLNRGESSKPLLRLPQGRVRS